VSRLPLCILSATLLLMSPTAFALGDGSVNGVDKTIDRTLVVDAEQSWHKETRQYSRIAATLELSGMLNESTSFTSIVRGQILGPNSADPGSPNQPAVSPSSQRIYINDAIELELRELYLDMDFESASLRLGKQQVVWGQADGLKLLDVVNPQDFRRFILDDFDDSRIPQWTVNLELFLEIGDLQLLWIPDTSMHSLPESDAEFALTAPFANLPRGMPVLLNPIDRPDNILEDADVGARLSMFLAGWDVTLNYLYHYDDFPVLQMHIANNQLALSPRFERTNTIGASASNAFGNFIFRMELAYNTDTYLASRVQDPGNTTNVNQVTATGELGYIFGLDWTGLSDTFVSAQLFQSHLLDGSDFSRDDVDTNLTLLVRRNFLNESLKLELLWIYHLNADDNLLRISGDYELASEVSMTLYADFFEGRASELFGQFDEKDQVGIRFSFGF